MNNIERLEEYYKKVVKNLNTWLPEGIIDVDIELLSQLKLLDFDKQLADTDDLTRYFHVIETDEKITLVNAQFAIWIVPDSNKDVATTYTIVALNSESEDPTIEMAFSVSGVYNTSRLVLRVLEKFLQEILENEEALNQLKKAS